MAQLRDAQTSQLVATGAPCDLVLVFDELGGAGRLLWDDVGQVDADALRAANTERLELTSQEQERQAAARELAAAVSAVLDSAQDPEVATLAPVDVTGPVAPDGD